MAWLIRGPSSNLRLEPEMSWANSSLPVFQQLRKALPIEGVPKLRLIRRRKSRKKNLPPDFYRPGGIWVVSLAFKKIIDDLEPTRNQFFPIEVCEKTGEELAASYFLMNVTQACDVLDYEKSDMESAWSEWKNPSGETVRVQQWYLQYQPKFLVAAPSAIGDKHLWRGREQLGTCLFFSDALMARVQEAKLKGIASFPIVEE